MNVWLIVLVAQVLFLGAPLVSSVIAAIHERGEDGNFAGAKVAFRS